MTDIEIYIYIYIYVCVCVCVYMYNSFRLFQTPGYSIEYETRKFRPDLHVRFHSSNLTNETISTYLWPALLDTATKHCVQKGVVIT